MYDSGSSQFALNLSQNIPNASMQMLMYSAVFGNMDLVVMPPSPGKVGTGYPTIDGPSVEALLYNSQMSNPIVTPSNILGGATAGTQTINGSQQITDQTGTTRLVMGYQQGGF